jgi:hypothetical protein
MRTSRFRRNASLIATAAVVTAYTASVFVFGQVVGVRDARLFSGHDTARIAMISRACGKHGALWQRPGSDDFACVYVSRGEAPMFEPVPTAVLLADWR